MIMEDNYDISKLKKKKKVNSRTKGASFERQIATMLNKRFNTKEFSRTPGSGAFATTHNLPEHLKLHGDLITPKNFRYCVECKKGYNKENLYSLYNYRSDFWKFILQCQKDSDLSKKVPMIIFKQDRQKTLVIVPSYIMYSIKKYIEIHKEENSYKVYYLDDLLKEEDYHWFD